MWNERDQTQNMIGEAAKSVSFDSGQHVQSTVSIFKK
jgi:hypothetical protein